MEVDDGEDKIVVVEGVKQGETCKQALLSPPKMSSNRAHTAMVI